MKTSNPVTLPAAARTRAAFMLAPAILFVALSCSCRRDTTPAPGSAEKATASQATTPANSAAASPATASTGSGNDASHSNAEVSILGTADNKGIVGSVKFSSVADGVRVVADINGLSPGEHGFHIHENGDCSGDGTAAGGHFNPTKKQHGARDSDDSHVGDMGNIKADENGHAHLEFTSKKLQLSGPNSIVGRALIVHGGRDDLKTQPSGDSGPRVACGVIMASAGSK